MNPKQRLALLLLTSFGLISCGSEPVSTPFLAQPIPKEKKEKKAAKKALSGKLTFSGLSDSQLADFRVIPESGKIFTAPVNRTYDQVDGFWFRPAAPAQWYKIPDSGEAWIGKEPVTSDGSHREHGLVVHYRSSPLLRAAAVFGLAPSGPGWVDSAVQRSPVSSTFKELARDPH